MSFNLFSLLGNFGSKILVKNAKSLFDFHSATYKSPQRIQTNQTKGKVQK